MGAFPLDLKTRRRSPYSHPHFCFSVPEGQSQPAFSIAKALSDEKKPQCFPMGVAGCQGDDQAPWESVPIPLLPINPARSQTHPRPGAAAREPSRTRCGSFGKVRETCAGLGTGWALHRNYPPGTLVPRCSERGLLRWLWSAAGALGRMPRLSSALHPPYFLMRLSASP